MSGLCEHCVQGHVLHGAPKGSFQDSAYFHPAPSPNTKRAIVVLTDIFGLKLMNSKLITDEYSKKLECDVWCPDIFAGSPPVTESELAPVVTDTPGVKIPFINKLKFIWVLLANLPGFIKNRPGVVDARITTFVKQLRQDKHYDKIGVIGYTSTGRNSFCFGGAEIVRLGSAGLFDSAVVAHPGRITKAQIEAMTLPTSWICAEEDFTFGTDLRNEAEAIFKRKKETRNVDYEFRDFKGTTHGFAARPNLSIPEIKKAFEDAFDQGVAWFEKTLG